MYKIKTSGYLFVWFTFVSIFAFLIPFYSNDYRYQLIEGTDDLVRSLSDIAVSQYRHYLTWGGRTPPHVLAQFLLLCGKYVSGIATGLCYVTMVYLIFVFGVGKKVNPFKLPAMPIIFITLGLWICLRSYGEVVFMLVSSCNYLFTTTFIMAFLLPYRFSLNDDATRNHRIGYGILAFVLGIIAGWCNENTGFAICSITGLLCVYLLIKKNLRVWHVLGLAGMGIGFLVLVLSPGNAARLGHMEETGTFNYFSHIFVALGIFGLTLLENLPLLLIFVYLRFLNHTHKLFDKYHSQLLGSNYAFAIGFAALAIMIFSPNFPARSTAPFTFFMLSAIIAAYAPLHSEKISIINPKLQTVTIGLCAAYVLVTMTNALGALEQARADQVVRDGQIKEQIESGKTDIVVPPLNVKTSRYIFINDINPKPTFFANVILKRYYHVSSIVTTCDNVKTLPHSDLIIYQKYGTPVCH